ncbi:hypothetical protein CTI14_36230 [Methylobacterium radiotolerans]|nr:hypothetical protein CTI14_36230 [Methylobacterium radiotolerans]
MDAVRRPGAGFHSGAGGQGAGPGAVQHVAAGVRHRRGRAHAGDRLRWTGHRHPRAWPVALHAPVAARLRRAAGPDRHRHLLPVRRPGLCLDHQPFRLTFKEFAMFAMFKKIALGALIAASLMQGAAQAAPAQAPEFTGIEKWLNSEPLTMELLRGKVVLVDFWTYTCINCIRTLPYVTSWHQKYKDQGLAVVGVHTPEFPFERSTAQCTKGAATLRHHLSGGAGQPLRHLDRLPQPVLPAAYLIDKQGKVVYTHFGEGRYKETEAEIQRLLAQPG